MLERLHEVGHHRVLEQHRHRPVRLQVARKDRRLVAPRADDNVAETALQVLEIARQAQDRHHFGGDSDVEPTLAGIAVGRPTERGDDLAQRTVIHVHNATPRHPAHVDIEIVPPVDVVVDQCRKKVVGRGDGVEIASEMEIDILHRHHLRHSAAGRAALDAEIRPQRGFAQADRRFLADGRQSIAKPDRGRGLTLARRRRADGGHKDQLAVRTIGKAFDEVCGEFRLVVAIGQKMLARNAELVADFADRLLARSPCDLDITSEFSHEKGLPEKSRLSEKP